MGRARCVPFRIPFLGPGKTQCYCKFSRNGGTRTRPEKASQPSHPAPEHSWAAGSSDLGVEATGSPPHMDGVLQGTGIDWTPFVRDNLSVYEVRWQIERNGPP